MSLADVQYQSRAQLLLQRAVLQQRVPHAYLFHGPDGVGKETLACGFAQLLLCSQPVELGPTGEPAEAVGVERLRSGCGQCEDCRAVGAQIHPDLHLIYRQLNRDHPDPVVRKRTGIELGVDVLRHFVIAKVGLTPVRGRAKVFVIREADRITVQAQNALLKTLEEPPGATFIILLASAEDRLLPTTRSRCQLVRFGALPTAFVARRLGELTSGPAAASLDWYARISDGSLGLALQQVEDELYEMNQRILEGLGRLPGVRSDGLVKAWTDESKSLGDRYRKGDPEISETEATRRGLKSVFRLAATWYADVLRAGSGETSSLVNTAWQDQIEAAATRIDPTRAADAVGCIARAEHRLDLNVNTQLCVETLLIDLGRIAAGKRVPS
jgi:DNA polymerase-3 subunit delta'